MPCIPCGSTDHAALQHIGMVISYVCSRSLQITIPPMKGSKRSPRRPAAGGPSSQRKLGTRVAVGVLAARRKNWGSSPLAIVLVRATGQAGHPGRGACVHLRTRTTTGRRLKQRQPQIPLAQARWPHGPSDRQPGIVEANSRFGLNCAAQPHDLRPRRSRSLRRLAAVGDAAPRRQRRIVEGLSCNATASSATLLMLACRASSTNSAMRW